MIHHSLSILISFYGIWNLDFFHFIIPPFCVSSAIKPIHITLFKCPIGSHTITAINIFVQKFYSYYRDGTEGGRDMRSLVCIYFFLRLLLYLVTVNQIPANVAFSILVFIYIACSTLIALAQPYKKPYMNYIDTLILGNLATISLILSQLGAQLSDTFTIFFYISGSTLASLPLLGLIGILSYKIIGKVTKLPYCKRLLHLHDQEGHNDTEDHNQLILESRELQESTVSVMRNTVVCTIVFHDILVSM